MQPATNPAGRQLRLLRKLLLAPSVLVPGGVGAVALGLALASANPVSMLGLVGAACLGVSLVIAGARYLFAFDEVLREVEGRSAAPVGGTLQSEIRLRSDGDPRTTDMLNRLNQVAGRLASLEKRAGKTAESGEVLEKARQLYQSCLQSLDHAWQNWKAAQEVATDDARRSLLSAREQIYGEVGQSIERLNATLDQFQVAALSRGDQQNLSQIQAELDMGLEVARNVQRRMNELDRELGLDRLGQSDSSVGK